MPEPYAFVGIPDEYLSESVYSREQMLDIFKAGAKWMAEKEETIEGSLGYGPHLQRPIIMLESVPSIWDGHCQEVIIQIRKK